MQRWKYMPQSIVGFSFSAPKRPKQCACVCMHAKPTHTIYLQIMMDFGYINFKFARIEEGKLYSSLSIQGSSMDSRAFGNEFRTMPLKE